MKNEVTLQETTMGTMRNAMMHTIMDIRNGNATAQEGVAVAKLGNTIVESYKTEIDAVRAVDGLKDRNVGYAKMLPIIGQNSNGGVNG